MYCVNQTLPENIDNMPVCLEIQQPSLLFQLSFYPKIFNILYFQILIEVLFEFFQLCIVQQNLNNEKVTKEALGKFGPNMIQLLR